MLVQQAFNKNPNKFMDIDDFIPVNLGTLVDVTGCSETKIICHSIGGIVTGDSLKYAHEILVSRAISAKFNIKLFVKLDQNDEEVKNVLSFFSKMGNCGQVNSDVAFLDEDNMTFSDWDIKNEYLKIIVPRKFAQQVIQLGNYSSDFLKEKFETDYVIDLLRDFEKKIKSPQTTDQQKAILFFFKRSYIASGNKSFFSSVKMFIDLSSYFNIKI